MEGMVKFMELRKDGWYRADNGKHFVLTEKGKRQAALQPPDNTDPETGLFPA